MKNLFILSFTLLLWLPSFGQESQNEEGKKCYYFTYERIQEYNTSHNMKPLIEKRKKGPYTEAECLAAQSSLPPSEELNHPYIKSRKSRLLEGCKCKSEQNSTTSSFSSDGGSPKRGSNDHTKNKLMRFKHLFSDDVHRELMANLENMPGHIILEDLNCENGKCTFTWKALDEDGSRRELNEAERELVQDYYEAVGNDIKAAQLEEKREQFENKSKAEIVVGVAEILVEGLSEIRQKGNSKILKIDSNGDGIDDTKVTIGTDGKPVYEPITEASESQNDPIPDGLVLESYHMSDDSEITFIDRDNDGEADFKVSYMENGSIVQEDLLEGSDGTDIDHNEAGGLAIEGEPEIHESGKNESPIVESGTDAKVQLKYPNITSSPQTRRDNEMSLDHLGNSKDSGSGNTSSHLSLTVGEFVNKTVSDGLDIYAEAYQKKYVEKKLYLQPIVRAAKGLYSLWSAPTLEQKSNASISIFSSLSLRFFPTYLYPGIHNTNKNSFDVMGKEVNATLDGNFKPRSIEEIILDMWFGRF